ncbi:MAG: DUF1566 domain-containing protein, partial [Methylococcales bacterium]|nr:DUF1566 domain-containing protein [Methylococcales bacterium]
SSCSGTASTYYDFEAANATTSNSFAGYNDWRVPCINDLDSIIEYSAYNPAINNTIFPNTPSNSFWTASASASNVPSAKYLVDFISGSNSINTNQGYASPPPRPVRLVRGGQSSCTSLGYTPTVDFTDNKNGTVTHHKTGLMWQRCPVGQLWNGVMCKGGLSRMDYNSASSQTSTLAGYSDWRLPTINELKSIIEYSNNDYATNSRTNSVIFPDAPADPFWSSSVSVYDPSNIAWIVMFQFGTPYPVNKNSNIYDVRLVRTALASDPTPTDLSTTISASTSSVKLNENLTYTATVTNNGTGTATNPTLIFYFPPRWTNYVSVPSDCVSNGRSYRCNAGDLAAGASLTRSITVNFAQRGATSIMGLGITDSVDTNAANNSGRIITTITQ